jgi:hypothetical protein
MPSQSDAFRDFGILPDNATPPAGVIRTNFGGGTIFGQYAATAIMSCIGLGISALFAFTLPLPLNLIAGPIFFALTVALIYFVTRNDYAWIELDGDIIRARHLYTGQVVERTVAEVDHLLTLVVQVKTLAITIRDKWLGRIRGIDIRFRDQRTPLRVNRSDPAMRNAKEFIQALVYRMSEKGRIDAEIINFEGSPLVRRIFWIEPPAE